MRFDKGYISPYMVTDTDRMEAVLEDPYILIANSKIANIKDLLPILEKVMQSGKPLAIIAEDIEGEALSTLVVNRVKNGLKVAAIKSPGFGEENRKDMVEDIAILTGGNFISEDLGYKLSNVVLSDLGQCDKVIINKDSTTIIGGSGNKEKIEKRMVQIRKQIESNKSEFKGKMLEERLAKLSGGVAVIYIGAASEVEMREKKDRVDDALHATKAAVEEGIVAGGGIAYIRATSSLDGLKGDNEDQTVGINIIRKAIEEPLRQIVSNCGDEVSFVINKVKEGKGDFGYNARTEKFEHLIKAGVIDPTKVSRVALQNAASAASMILTTECALIHINDEKKSNDN